MLGLQLGRIDLMEVRTWITPKTHNISFAFVRFQRCISVCITFETFNGTNAKASIKTRTQYVSVDIEWYIYSTVDSRYSTRYRREEKSRIR